MHSLKIVVPCCSVCCLKQIFASSASSSWWKFYLPVCCIICKVCMLALGADARSFAMGKKPHEILNVLDICFKDSRY